MPDAHRRHGSWTPSRIVSWAERTGPATAKLVAEIMATRRHPEQGFRSCLGIVRLEDRYGKDRLEAAATRALALSSYSYRSVESILKNGLEAQALPGEQGDERTHPDHPYVRGADYYR
jgi:transposase